MTKVNLELTHGSDNGHHALDDVAVYDWTIGQAFLLRIALLVDDSVATKHQQQLFSFNAIIIVVLKVTTRRKIHTFHLINQGHKIHYLPPRYLFFLLFNHQN